MKIILTQDVKKLGKRGAVLEVADGYGTFLLQKGFAKLGSAQAVATAMNAVKQKQSSVDAEVDKMMQAYKQLEGKEIVIPVRVNEKGSMYAQIHALDIVEAIKKQFGVIFAPLHIRLDEPLKHVGEYTLLVQAGSVKKNLTIKLVAQSAHL